MTSTQKNTAQQPIRIVIAGAGFGGVYTFKKLHSFFHGNPNIKLILINSRNYFLFTPLLHEVATGGVSRENIVEPLRRVLGCCLSEFHLAEVKTIELEKKRVLTTRGECAYDYLVLALGATTNFFGTPGAEQHAFTLKTLEDAVRLKNHFIKKFEQASAAPDKETCETALSFVVVGGGPTGVELAAEMAELFYDTFERSYNHQSFCQNARITLVQSDSELLPNFSKNMREKSLEVLRRKKVAVRLGCAVKSIDASGVALVNGEFLPAETVVWTAGVRPSPLAFDRDVERTASGRIIVNEYLQMKNAPEVFILGDMAGFLANGRELPPLAQVAHKESATVAANIRNIMLGVPLIPFSYKHTGDLISLGQWVAVGQIRNVFFWGRLAWWLWRTVYLSKLISWPKKIKVAADWFINLFLPRDISEL
jgi:NADH dehydrogenase